MAYNRMSAKEVRQTARSLEKSLDSAHKGLVMLLKSLQQSGFGEAASSYQQMQLVLIQQRLWAKSQKRNELIFRWQRIAETAAQIHAIMAPLTDVMARLRGIDRIEQIEPTATLPATNTKTLPNVNPEQNGSRGDVNPELEALADLLMKKLAVSDYKLSKQWFRSTKDDRLLLDNLVQAGLIEPHGWGKGHSYTLTPDIRQKLVTILARILTAETARGEPTPLNPKGE